MNTDDQDDYQVEGSSTQVSSAPPELHPSSTPEPLNPWLTVVHRPRDTIRYVLDTGEWNNIWLLYAIVLFGSIPAVALGFFSQPAPGGIPAEAFYIGFSVAYILLGYPFAMLMLYFLGWLTKVVGSWFGGGATNRETRIALAWAYIITLYINLMMLIPNALLIISCRPWEIEDPEVQMKYSLITMAISIPSMVLNVFFISKCLAEAHRFSAWKGLLTFVITGTIWTAFCMFLMFILISFIFLIAFVASA